MNILLKYKLKGYKRAHINKKKKRQHGKPLNFKLTTPEDGKATFYSPTSGKNLPAFNFASLPF